MAANKNFSRWIGSVFAARRSEPAAGYHSERAAAALAVLRSATLSFTGYSTTGGFVGSTKTASGLVEGELSTARGWVETPVATLTTRNAFRDRDMRTALEAERYPLMRFDLERVETLLDV